MNFNEHFIAGIYKNSSNYYLDNYNELRYGQRKRSLKKIISDKLKKGLSKYHISSMEFLNSAIQSKALYYFEYLYNKLKDTESRELLINVLLFRLMGPEKVKLPLAIEKSRRDINFINSLKKSKSISTKTGWSLDHYDLNGIGYPINIYYNPLGIFTDFMVKQYEYNNGQLSIKAEEGDIIIDGGGCWGDTALYFSNCGGKGGKVYTFEFIPGNLDILRTNLALNPLLEKNVTIIENPIWGIDGENVYFKDMGPGSYVSFERKSEEDMVVKTITIDKLVKNEQVQKVDFIKLDIEGAELEALKGAKETMINFKPKLAIALYHNVQDFYEIPKFINDLNLGYEFYFKHATDYGEESLLFAKI